MQSLTELNALIDRAAAIAGSDYKLAQQLQVTRQTISNWRHGAAPCPVESQALIAHVAGLDPLAELARAVVRKHEGTAKGDMLMKALGKPLLAIGAVLGSAGAAAHQIFSMVPTATHLGEQLLRITQCALC